MSHSASHRAHLPLAAFAPISCPDQIRRSGGGAAGTPEFAIMNRRTLLLGAALSAFAGSGRVFGQSWPDRALRIVVPFAAGSFTDVAARLVANELTGQLGQPVI